MGDTVTGRISHAFSKQHLFAARHFAGLATSEAKPGAAEIDLRVHRAYVTASVVLASAFLEASINELIFEAADPGRAVHLGLNAPQLKELARQSTAPAVLVRYRRALDVCRKLMDPAIDPWLAAEGLVKLRNALMHYESEWDDELKKHESLRDRLDGRFDPNPLVPPGSLWFPHLCMSAGCAEWAVKTATVFSAEFCQHMGIPDRAA